MQTEARRINKRKWWDAKDVKNWHTASLQAFSRCLFSLSTLLRDFLSATQYFLKSCTTIILNDLYNRAKFLKNMCLISTSPHTSSQFLLLRWELGA